MPANKVSDYQSAGLIANYHKFMQENRPLATPREAVEILLKHMNTPDPHEYLMQNPIPDNLQTLWYEARLSKERFDTAFADYFMNADPLERRVVNNSREARGHFASFKKGAD